MKRSRLLFLTTALAGLLSLPGKAQENPLPSNMRYDRAWSDSIHIFWDRPQVTDASGTSLGKEGGWTDLDLRHIQTLRLPAPYVGTNNYSEPPRNPFSDGKYIYSASWASSGTSTFYKYDLLGNFLERFKIEGVTGSFRDFAYDGEYFYAAMEGTKNLYKLDMENKKIVETISMPVDVRHICFIPELDGGKGGFEVGDWDNSTLIDKTGKILKENALEFGQADDLTTSPNLQVYGTAYHNGKIYAHCLLGKDTMIDGRGKYLGPYSRIVEFDLESGKTTGRRLVLARNISGQETSYGLRNYEKAAGIEVLEFPKGRFQLIVGYQDVGQNYAPLLFLELEDTRLPEALEGYNLYVDGKKLNTGLIPEETFHYGIGKLAQGQSHDIELKAVYGGVETDPASLSVNLTDSRLLPFMEDFNSQRLEQNYWDVENIRMEGAPWRISMLTSNISGMDDVIALDYYGGTGDSLMRDEILSKEFCFEDNQSILFRYQVGQRNPFGMPRFTDSLMLEYNAGDGWVVIDIDTTVANGKAMEYKTLDLTEQLAGKESVRFRFRVQGNSKNKYGYDFYIDNVKIWEPDYTTLSGSVRHGDLYLENVAIRLQNVDDVNYYDLVSDNKGTFDLGEIEKGRYAVTAQRKDFNLFTDTIEVDEAYVLDIDMAQPVFASSTDTLRVTMKPDEILNTGFVFRNDGDGPTLWSATFSFPAENQSKGAENFPLMESWKARGNVEKHFAYLRDTLYSHYNTGGENYLLMALRDGTILEEQIHVPAQKYARFGPMFTDNEYLYFTYNQFIYQYDIRTRSILDTIEAPASIRAATYNSLENTIYVADWNNIYEIDRDGNPQDTLSIQGLSVTYIAFDPVSHSNKPVLWLTRSYAQPEGSSKGEYVGVYEYSLDSAKLTGRFFVANQHPDYFVPNYNGRETVSVEGLFGSTKLFPGKFVLFTNLVYNAYSTSYANLCGVYDVAQSVKWVGMDEFKGHLEASASAPFNLTFNSEGLEDGEEKRCTIHFKSDLSIPSLNIPVVLSIDKDYVTPYYAPGEFVAEAESSTKINLSWSLTDENGNEVTEGLKGFNIKRNGSVLTEELVSGFEYADNDPMIGKNVYEIQAAYEYADRQGFSAWVASDTIEIVYDGPCATVTNLEAEITRQRHLTLTWDCPQNEFPDANIISESFEGLEAFNVETIGNGWTVKDVDRADTYGLNGADFPNQGEPMAFIVFNPSKTEPSSVHRLGAYSGKQMLACFGSRVASSPNNDWVISPEIKYQGENTYFSFMAQTAFVQYGMETIKVAYSTTGTDIDDFIYFDEGKNISVPAEWTEYSFKLPKGTKYVAVNCVSKDKFVLLLDEMYIGPSRNRLLVDSYNIYKNDELFASITPQAYGFFDYALQEGEHTYAVEASYTNGCVSPKSEPAKVDIDFKHGITAPRFLEAEVNEDAKSVDLNWFEPAWGESEKIGYYNEEDGMLYGFAISGQDNEPAPFQVAIKLDITDPTLIDYSISALQIGYFDNCASEIFVIDMTDNVIVHKQKVRAMNVKNFTTIGLDKPVKLELNKSYLVGYSVSDYLAGTFPAGQDNGPLVEGYGDWFSPDGIQWTTVKDYFQGSVLANWAIDVVLEVVESPFDAKGEQPETVKLSFGKPDVKVEAHREQARASVANVFAPVKGAAPEVAVKGYQVYRDGDMLEEVSSDQLTYSDQAVTKGETYAYKVAANYENGEKAFGEEVSVLFTYETSLEEALREAGFKVWTKDNQVYVSNGNTDSYNLEVRSLNGQSLVRRNTVSDQLYCLPMNVPQGVYILVIEYNGESHAQRILLY